MQPMRLITEVLWGKRRETRQIVEPNTQLTIGSSERANLVLSHDKKLGGVHLTLSWDGERCELSSKRGVLLAGDEATSGTVPHGCWIRAGETDLLVSFEGTLGTALDHNDGERPTDANEAEQRVVALQQLTPLIGDLYAVVDTSRDSVLLPLLRESVDRRSCLYEGQQAEAMHDVAPYLIKVRKDSRLLERLINRGWTKRWATFFHSKKKFKSVRTHLRRFLMVKEEASGQDLYFRFYDPTVMRTFMGMITPRQRALLSGKGILDEALVCEPTPDQSSFVQEPPGTLIHLPIQALTP